MTLHNWMNEELILHVPEERWDAIKEGDVVVIHRLLKAAVALRLAKISVKANVIYAWDPYHKHFMNAWFPDWKKKAGADVIP